MIATKAIRTLPPVEQCSVAPDAIKSAKPAELTKLVEFCVKSHRENASTLVAFVEGHSIDVSEFNVHLAFCKNPSENESNSKMQLSCFAEKHFSLAMLL